MEVTLNEDQTMENAIVLSKLDYGYLVVIEEEKVFLESSKEYQIDSIIKVIRVVDKCVDYCIVDHTTIEGISIVKVSKGKATINKQEIVVCLPKEHDKYVAVVIEKMQQFYVGKVIMTTTCIMGNKEKHVIDQLKSVAINSLQYFMPHFDDISQAKPAAKFAKFCKEFSLVCMEIESELFFTSELKEGMPVYKHQMPYGLLVDNNQFNMYKDMCRGLQCDFKVTEVLTQNKKKVGFWCTINSFKGFLPMHHTVQKVKIGDVYKGIIWDIQQDTVVVSLQPYTISSFPTLVAVKEFVLSQKTLKVVVRQIEGNKMQVDFFGIRSWLSGTAKVGQLLNVQPSGSMSNIHFNHSWSLIDCPSTFEPSEFTRDVVHVASDKALYGPPLIVKPMVLCSNKFEVQHCFPFWIQKIDQNQLYLLTWHNNAIHRAVAFKNNITEYFLTDLSIFKVGQTVLGCIIEFNDHGAIVSLKSSLVNNSIHSHGLNVPSHVSCINSVPDFVLTLLKHTPREHIGKDVECTLIKTVSTGLHVSFTINNTIQQGFIQTANIPQSKFNAKIISHHSALFDLIMPIKTHRDAQVVHLTPHYAICSFSGKIGYIPTRTFNTPIQHGFKLNDIVKVTPNDIDGILLLERQTMKLNKRMKPTNQEAVVSKVHPTYYSIKVGKSTGRLFNHLATSQLDVNQTITVSNVSHSDYTMAPIRLELNTMVKATIISIENDLAVCQLMPNCRGFLYQFAFQESFNTLKVGQVITATLSHMTENKYYLSTVKNKAMCIKENKADYLMRKSTGELAYIFKLDADLKIGDVIVIKNEELYKGKFYLNTTMPVESGLTKGIVVGINKGVYVQLSYNTVGKILIKDLHDDFIKDFQNLVTIHQVVTVYVLNSSYNLSMKASHCFPHFKPAIDDIMICKVIHKNIVYTQSEPILKGTLNIERPVGSILECKITQLKPLQFSAESNLDEMVIDQDISSISSQSQVSWSSDNEDEVVVEVEQPFYKNKEMERKLLIEPNSSLLWIEYMGLAYSASMRDARHIGKRALKSIHYQEEAEKKNIVLAILNLEIQGNDGKFEQNLDELMLTNDHKVILVHCLKQCIQYKKLKLLDCAIKKALKEFKHSCKVWLLVIEGRFENASMLMQKALQCLEKHKHLKLISKYAQMEFKMGDKEKSRTVWMGLMSEHSKRLDLWMVWADLEIKYKQIDQARQVFRKMVDIKFKAKQTKYIFEKYLQFEQSFGDSKSCLKVQQEAAHYLKELNMK